MPAATGSGLYVLDEATVTGEYVAALSSDLKQFLLRKSPGHCQRVDYLPRPVMEQLGRVLASDADLRAAKVACRVLTDRSGTLEAWEASGSGAVALREDATYGRIKVFCALFPAGLRLAEEDSLNVATFKTDDAESFDARKCILAHLNGKVNLLPTPEKDIKAPPTLEMLAAVLDHWSHDRGVQVRNLLVRLQPLFKSGIFKQGKTSFTFDDLFQRTTVLLMTSGIKDLMLAASRFMLDKVYAAMLTRGVTRDLRVMVVVDEAHKLCGDETITSLIKEARKYGLGLVLSSQETRDFHPSIFANTGTLISLALEDADASVMANHLGLTEKADQKVAKQIILDQASGEALIRSTHFKPYQQIRVLSFEDRRHQA